MDLTEFLADECVLPAMTAGSKTEAVAELAAPLAAHLGLNPSVLVDILMAREALGSTAVGNGCAVPHGKVPGLAAPVLAVGRSPAGLDFDAADNELCKLFFLILTPEGGACLHLKLLAQTAKRIRDPNFRAGLLAAPDLPGMLQVLAAP